MFDLWAKTSTESDLDWEEINHTWEWEWFSMYILKEVITSTKSLQLRQIYFSCCSHLNRQECNHALSSYHTWFKKRSCWKTFYSTATVYCQNNEASKSQWPLVFRMIVMRKKNMVKGLSGDEEKCLCASASTRGHFH